MLLISSKPEDLVFASQVASTAGLTLQHSKTAEGIAQSLIAETFSSIIVDTSTASDYQKFEKTLQESLGLFSDKINANAIHFLSSTELDKCEYLTKSPIFGHFILRTGETEKDFQSAGQFYGRIVKATLAERAFGLQHLLDSNAKIQAIQLKNSNSKLNTVDAVKAFLVAAKFQSRIATIIANSADELLMNAMYDAPIDDIGHPTLTQTPRNTPLKLEGKSSVEMHIGFDGQYLGISAIDLFGSLDKTKLLSHITKIYAKEEYRVKNSVAGAGLGLASVFRAGGSFFFISESRLKTEVVVFFKKTDNFIEFKKQFRFVSTQFYF